MRLSEYIANHRDEMDWADHTPPPPGQDQALAEDHGAPLLVTIDSSMLPGVNVDTYQCFNGDSWTESELDYLSTEGIPDWLVGHPAAQRATVELEWDDFDWTYDHEGIRRGLADAAAGDLVMAGGVDFPQIFTGYEILSTFAPQFYNFATDSFNAQWEVDIVELVDALDDIDVDELEAWARDRWASRDGFMSSIPRYFDTEHPWAVVWAAVAKVLIDSDYDGTISVAEVEYEIYSEHTRIELNSRGAEKIWTACTGAEVPEDADLHDAESLTVALHDALPGQEEELPIPA